MTPVFNAPNIVYWLVIIVSISITTTTLGPLWRRQENHRWTTGYAVVFLLGSTLVALGFWDLNTWAGLFFAVGLSGIIKVGYEQYHKSKDAEAIRKGVANDDKPPVG